ncbi:hypothetical protein L7F22_054596 [Adiantum nelumboides]|nr:hypothetical protein [Adiantum nelumboides]
MSTYTLSIQIKDFVRQMLVDLWQGKLPSVSLAKYQLCSVFSKESRCLAFEKSDNQENLSLQQRGSAQRLVVMLRVLGIVQQLLEQDKHASKRDIYYTDPALFHDFFSLFRNSMADKGKGKLLVEESSSSTRRHRRETAAVDTQFMASARTTARTSRAPRPSMTAEEQEENDLFTAQLMSMMGTFEQLAKNPRMQKLLKTKDYRTDVKTIDQAINDICIHFNCNRGSLNVVSVSKGLVMGWLRYNDDGRKIDCMKYSCTGLSIPVHTNLVQNITSLADYILLVEKETVFQRLANDGYCLKNRCIILSGKGYPDVATRSFLRLLKDKLHLPVFGLVDGDPYGLDILLTYTFGSLTMAYDAEALVTPSIHWLGVLLSDCEAFGVPARCLLPLTTKDKQKASAILKRPYVKRYVPFWSNQVEMMLQQAVKVEIEAVASISFSFLAECYLPSKIQGGSYL